MPEEIYHPVGDLDRVAPGLSLVVAIPGFTDTGSTVAQLSQHLLSSLEHEPLVEFDMDVLYDYRGRRPSIVFDTDHLTGYEPPRLTLSLVKDELGARFLLLHGLEPDFRWNGFADAVEDLVTRLDVASFTWVHAIPMPAPHTRPLNVTVSGNRHDLISAMSVWQPQVQVPANAIHMLEYRLSERQIPIAGFVILVPHYLGDNEYPEAAVKALEVIGLATGLILPSDSLREEGREFLARLAAQIADNEELQQMIGGLEQRYDAFMANTELRSPLIGDEGNLPTADQLAAEWERFLATRPSPEPPTAGQ